MLIILFFIFSWHIKTCLLKQWKKSVSCSLVLAQPDSHYVNSKYKFIGPYSPLLFLSIVYFITPLSSAPSPSRTPSYTVQQYGRDSVTLTVQWQPPQYDGGAPVNYTITVSPGVGTFTTSGASILVAAVPYNVIHTVSIVATNCNGSSSPAVVTIRIGVLK